MVTETASGVTLREAGVDEVETLLSLVYRAFAEYKDKLDPPSGAPYDTAEKLAEHMQTASAVIADFEDSPVACTFYSPREGHVYLFRLSVLPEFRRQGIAKMLIDYVERRAVEMGFDVVKLGVRVALHRNREYYEQMGYSLEEERFHPGYDKPTYVIMAKAVP
jgi:ribosomal protein S18 acetylase RimI-like enzyme